MAGSFLNKIQKSRDRVFMSENEDNSNDNVVKLPKKNVPMRKQNIYKQTIEFITDKKRATEFSNWPVMKETFHVIRDEFGDRRFVEELPNKVMRPVGENRIISAIASYWHNDHRELVGKMTLLTAEADKCFRLWASTAQEFTKTILPVAELSQDVYTYRRLPFDFDMTASATDYEDNCAYFFEMMGRTSNSDALMAWIGSLFDPNSSRQQYVWIHGHGLNGKGSLSRVLMRIFGSAASAEEVPAKDNRFWTRGLLGKRLVVFPDCNNYGFPSTGLFKTITGGDPIRVEEKNGPTYSIIPTAKILFLSNNKPSISTSSADLRRAIFCHMKPLVFDCTNDYEERLWEEVPMFIGQCIMAYKRLTLKGGMLKSDTTEIEAVASFNEESYDVIANKYLEFGEFEDKDCVNGLQMQQIFKAEGLRDKFEQKHFYDYVERLYGTKRTYFRDGEKRFWGYKGCKLRKPMHNYASSSSWMND